jgi:hypothetical protein
VSSISTPLCIVPRHPDPTYYRHCLQGTELAASRTHCTSLARRDARPASLFQQLVPLGQPSRIDNTKITALVCCMRFVAQSVNKEDNLLGGGGGRISACFILGSARRSSVKFGTGVLHQKLGNYILGSYRSNISPELYNVQIEFYRCP